MILKDFLEFLKEYKVVGLAIGVVIGVKVNDLVTAVVNNLLMPFVGLVLPSNNWKDMAYEVAGARFGFGEVLSAALEFTLVALVVFLTAKYVLKQEKVGKI